MHRAIPSFRDYHLFVHVAPCHPVGSWAYTRDIHQTIHCFKPYRGFRRVTALAPHYEDHAAHLRVIAIDNTARSSASERRRSISTAAVSHYTVYPSLAVSRGLSLRHFRHFRVGHRSRRTIFSSFHAQGAYSFGMATCPIARPRHPIDLGVRPRHAPDRAFVPCPTEALYRVSILSSVRTTVHPPLHPRQVTTRDPLQALAAMTGPEPSRPNLQSIIPAAIATVDAVPYERDYPKDVYFYESPHVRLGWLGDAVGEDLIATPSSASVALDPTLPAWSMPAWPTIRRIFSDTVRVPTTTDPSARLHHTIVAPQRSATTNPFEPSARWHDALLACLRRIRSAAGLASPCLLEGFFDEDDDEVHLGTLVAIIIAVVEHEMSKHTTAITQRSRRWTILLEGGTHTAIPPVTRKDPGPFSVRVCDDVCNRCSIHDDLARRMNLTDNATIDDIIEFGTTLRSPDSGWSPHYPKVDVFRVPEESTPACSPEDLPRKLRHEVQAFFDNHADNLPQEPISTRSPLYQYDEHGGVVLEWSNGLLPEIMTHTITRPGIQRRVLLQEILKDLVWHDIDPVPIQDIKASAVLFVVFHRVTGDPRVCAAPYEANAMTEPRPVRYGSIWDLFTSKRLTCGCRGDIGRGFKHIRLARRCAVHVAFVVDGRALLPRTTYFGLRDGPRIFVTTLKVDLDSVPSIPVPDGEAISALVAWVDDLTKLASNPELAVRVIFVLAVHLVTRRWKCPPKKWFALPAALLKYIGYITDPPRAATRLSRALTVKLAVTARDLLRAASMRAGAKVSDLQRAITSTHFGRLAFGAKDIPLLAFARAVVDRSVAEGFWRPGARELIIIHAIDAPRWHALRTQDNAAIITRTLLLSSDASVTAASSATPRSRVTGGGHWLLINSDVDPASCPDMEDRSRSFFSLEVDPKSFGIDGTEVSSTWAEACIAAYAIRRKQLAGILHDIQLLVLKLDAMTVVSRAPKCSTESLQVSAFYAYMHRAAQVFAFRLYILWHSREQLLAKMSDAVSTVATGLWRLSLSEGWFALAEQCFRALCHVGGPPGPNPTGSLPPVHIFADDRSSLAPSYASGHLPDSDDRREALRSVPVWSSPFKDGLVGLPEAVTWTDRLLAITLIPANLRWLPLLARQASSSSGWTALVMAVMVPDLVGVIHAIMAEGVVIHTIWHIDPLARWITAPDGATPLFQRFPSAWFIMSRHANHLSHHTILRAMPPRIAAAANHCSLPPQPTTADLERVFRPQGTAPSYLTAPEATTAADAAATAATPVERSVQRPPDGMIPTTPVISAGPRVAQVGRRSADRWRSGTDEASGSPEAAPRCQPSGDASQRPSAPGDSVRRNANAAARSPTTDQQRRHAREPTPCWQPAAGAAARIREIIASIIFADPRSHVANAISAHAEMSAGVVVPILAASAAEHHVRERARDLIRMDGTFTPSAILTQRGRNAAFVFLVTKLRIGKRFLPDAESLRVALLHMWQQLLHYDSPSVAMPRIGCGRDRMHWQTVWPLLLRTAAMVPRRDGAPWDITVHSLRRHDDSQPGQAWIAGGVIRGWTAVDARTRRGTARCREVAAPTATIATATPRDTRGAVRRPAARSRRKPKPPPVRRPGLLLRVMRAKRPGAVQLVRGGRTVDPKGVIITGPGGWYTRWDDLCDILEESRKGEEVGSGADSSKSAKSGSERLSMEVTDPDTTPDREQKEEVPARVAGAQADTGDPRKPCSAGRQPLRQPAFLRKLRSKRKAEAIRALQLERHLDHESSEDQVRSSDLSQSSEADASSIEGPSRPPPQVSGALPPKRRRPPAKLMQRARRKAAKAVARLSIETLSSGRSSPTKADGQQRPST